MFGAFFLVLAGLAAQSDAPAPEQSFNITSALLIEAPSPETATILEVQHLFTHAAPHRSSDDPTATFFDLFHRENFAHLNAGFNLGRLSRLQTGMSLPGPFRIEAEVSYLQHDVDVGRAFLIGAEATGDETEKNLHAPTPNLEAVLRDRMGKVEAKATFANGFVNLPWAQSLLQPYLGAGIGVAQVDIDYRPSGITVMNESNTVFAYQLMAGAQFKSEAGVDWRLSARYRGMDDHDMDETLLPHALQLEGEGVIAEFGLRYGF